jgi:hypothetical protein
VAKSTIDNKSCLIDDWCNVNKLKINSDKTQDLYFNLSPTNVNITSLKFLGILVQSNLKWQLHIDKVASSIAKGLFLLRSLSGSVSRKVLLCIYFAHVHSHIAYGTILWANTHYAKKIFVLQKRAIRIISGVPNRTHCRELFVELGVLSLPSLYIFQVLVYIKETLPSLTVNADVHSHFTRHNRDLALTRCKYSLTQSSFVQMGIRFYNALPYKVKQQPSKQFKKNMKDLLLRECLYDSNEFFNCTALIS